MPSDFFLNAMNALHRAALKVSGGKVGWRLAGMPVLELTTVGRKSGKPRACMLTSPVQLGEAYVIVASRGGDDHHPAWFLNLKAHPEVEVTLPGRAKVPMRARVATKDERTELWPRITARYKGYAAYQARTEREIPVVILDPV